MKSKKEDNKTMTMVCCVAIYLVLLKMFNHILFLKILKVSAVISIMALILQCIIATIKSIQDKPQETNVNYFKK